MFGSLAHKEKEDVLGARPAVRPAARAQLPNGRPLGDYPETLVLYRKHAGEKAMGRGRVGTARLKQLRPGDVGMSIVTHLKLVCGAWKSRWREENLTRIRESERLIPVLPLDAGVGRYYGEVRADLERKGTPIGAYDLLIAAHALSLGLILVTNNTREFRRIPQLIVENWAEE